MSCGLKNAGQRQYIVGGSLSEPGQWPWHVSVRMNGTQFCGGSILSPHLILTAAHCFDDLITSKEAKDWSVTAGDYNFQETEEFEENIQVKKILLHPRFSFKLISTQSREYVVAKNDVALLQLMRPINVHDKNKGTICLPNNKQILSPKSECTITGWGHDSFKGKQTDLLHQAKVPIVSPKDCNSVEAYNNTIHDGLLCAGNSMGGVDSCNYDSGGSLVCVHNGRWFAQGIASSGYECARPYAYGLYTRVAKIKHWIVKTAVEIGEK